MAIFHQPGLCPLLSHMRKSGSAEPRQRGCFTPFETHGHTTHQDPCFRKDKRRALQHVTGCRIATPAPGSVLSEGRSRMTLLCRTAWTSLSPQLEYANTAMHVSPCKFMQCMKLVQPARRRKLTHPNGRRTPARTLARPTQMEGKLFFEARMRACTRIHVYRGHRPGRVEHGQ